MRVRSGQTGKNIAGISIVTARKPGCRALSKDQKQVKKADRRSFSVALRTEGL